jgi:hypothetical protein
MISRSRPQVSVAVRGGTSALLLKWLTAEGPGGDDSEVSDHGFRGLARCSPLHSRDPSGYSKIKTNMFFSVLWADFKRGAREGSRRVSFPPCASRAPRLTV